MSNRKFTTIPTDSNFVRGVINNAINELRLAGFKHHNATLVLKQIDKYRHIKFEDKETLRIFHKLYKQECKNYENDVRNNFLFTPEKIGPILLIRMAIDNIISR